jgi:hypothetical protein
VDIRASVLSNAFFIEAEMLWHAEKSCDSITTAAALHLFSYGCVTRGKDELGLQLCKEGRYMAERLNLFGVPQDDSSTARFKTMSPEWKRATAHTAWGIYNWLS